MTLVDCPAGIERIAARGVVVDGEEIALDCIIYATGFEAELTPFPRRATHPIVGRGGMTIAEKFADGPITLHGLMTGGFPNLFLMPAPGLQSVVTVNYTHLAVEGAEHIAADDRDARAARRPGRRRRCPRPKRRGRRRS